MKQDESNDQYCIETLHSYLIFNSFYFKSGNCIVSLGQVITAKSSSLSFCVSSIDKKMITRLSLTLVSGHDRKRVRERHSYKILTNNFENGYKNAL